MKVPIIPFFAIFSSVKDDIPKPYSPQNTTDSMQETPELDCYMPSNFDSIFPKRSCKSSSVPHYQPLSVSHSHLRSGLGPFTPILTPSLFTSLPQDSFQTISEKAKAGNPVSQYNLGLMYDKGEVLLQDYYQARKWYKKAAEQGFAQAQLALGVMYYYEKGVKQDFKQAAEWYKKAAFQNNAAAQSALGNMYRRVDGVEQDLTKALKWLKKAAENGDAQAQYNLGAMYMKGLDVNRDIDKALFYLEKAATQNYKDAKKQVQSLKNAKQKLAYELAMKYLNGEGVATDSKKAVKMLKIIANDGYTNAQYKLADMYHKGRGVKKNLKKAIMWYEKAADQGSDLAKEGLKTARIDSFLKRLENGGFKKLSRKALEKESKKIDKYLKEETGAGVQEKLKKYAIFSKSTY